MGRCAVYYHFSSQANIKPPLSEFEFIDILLTLKDRITAVVYCQRPRVQNIYWQFEKAGSLIIGIVNISSNSKKKLRPPYRDFHIKIVPGTSISAIFCKHENKLPLLVRKNSKKRLNPRTQADTK